MEIFFNRLVWRGRFVLNILFYIDGIFWCESMQKFQVINLEKSVDCVLSGHNWVFFP